jgi:hypothetical protein
VKCKGVFSSAIVNAAIGAIHKLVCAMPKAQRKMILSTVEGGLQEIVNGEVIQAICDMHISSRTEVSSLNTQLSVYV